jgi:hypothetical protein
VKSSNLFRFFGPPSNTNDEIKPTGSKRRATEFYTDHTYFARVEKIEPDHDEVVVETSSSSIDDEDEVVVVVGDNHVVIKKEDETDNTKHASLGISLPQKLQILLVSLITMWLTNPRLTNYLTSMSMAD